MEKLNMTRILIRYVRALVAADVLFCLPILFCQIWFSNSCFLCVIVIPVGIGTGMDAEALNYRMETSSRDRRCTSKNLSQKITKLLEEFLVHGTFMIVLLSG
jgi:hypothetical protein